MGGGEGGPELDPPLYYQCLEFIFFTCIKTFSVLFIFLQKTTYQLIIKSIG